MSADILQFVRVTEAPNRIRELRVQADLSQQALGERIGVSKVTISDLERGEMALTLDYMQRIAEALGVFASDLLPQKDSPDALTLDERQLLAKLRTATAEQRDQIHKMADVIVPYRPQEPENERLHPRKSA